MKLSTKEIESIILEAMFRLHSAKHLDFSLVSLDGRDDFCKVTLLDKFLYSKNLQGADGRRAGMFYVILGDELGEKESTQAVDSYANIPSKTDIKTRILLRIAYQIYALFMGSITNLYNDIKTDNMPIGTYKVARDGYEKLK